MFSEIVEDGVRWSDGTVLRADVILWCTGFRSSLDHLAPLMLHEPGGGITMIGRLSRRCSAGRLPIATTDSVAFNAKLGLTGVKRLRVEIVK